MSAPGPGTESLSFGESLTLMQGRLVHAPAQGVSPPIELPEVMIGQHMPDRLGLVRRFQILFGHVGREISLIDQHVIPRFVFRRTGPRDFIIPRVRRAEDRIDIENDTQIVEQLVMNHFAHLKFGFMS